MSKARISHLACAFRNALEEVARTEDDIFLEDFPLGACGNASLMLAAYLTECRLSNEIAYVSGVCIKDGAHNGRSHGWLECEGIIVDITADQFPGRLKVYCDSDDGFYAAFAEREIINPWSLSLNGGSIYGDILGATYAKVRQYIDFMMPGT